MKICTVCGCHNDDGARVCSVCGVRFPETAVPTAPPPVAAPSSAPAAVPVSVSVPAPVPVSASVKQEEDHKPDRMALAGFILSLMGCVTCMTSPLQLAALILSVSAGKAKKFRTLRWIGILLSAVALGISLILWLVVAINADGILSYITGVFNEFYY